MKQELKDKKSKLAQLMAQKEESSIQDLADSYI